MFVRSWHKLVRECIVWPFNCHSRRRGVKTVMATSSPKSKGKSPKTPKELKETPEMLAAFNAYLAMGDKRSIAKLAVQLKKSRSTLTKWSNRLYWAQRIEGIQHEAMAKAEAEAEARYFASVENLTSFKHDILDTLKKRVGLERHCPECGTHRMDVGDLIRVLQVIKTELGEPTSITKGSIDVERDNPFADIFSRMFPTPGNANAEPATGRQVPQK